MNSLKVLWRTRILSFVLFLAPLSGIGQVQTARYISTNPRSNAFYEYLPQGYNSGTQKYPLLLFIHGMGELGAGTPSTLPNVLRNGPPKLINQGAFPTSFTVNNETFRYIVLSPQFTEWPGPSDINLLINYAIQNYRVDESRIYLTGLSMGGGVVWEYAGNNATYANRLAAIIPICGASWPDQGRANIMAGADLAVWATHNSGDPTAPVFYTNDYVNYINSAPNPPTPLAKKTIFNSNSHDAWSTTYNPSYKENGLNVYEWMLLYKRNIGANQPPVPNAGPDRTITLPVNSVRIEASANDPDGTISSVQWTKVSGPSAGVIENPGGLWTNIINLVQGTYVFRLRVVDNGGAQGIDEVTITVNGSSPQNQLPTANAGPDQSITLPQNSVQLNGSGSDPDGNIISYAWSKLSGPSGGSIASPNAASTQVSSLNQGTYVFRLTVTDNNNATRSDDVNVIVSPQPVVTPGDPKTVQVNIYGGSNPFSNNQWNNWNTSSNMTSGTFLNTDQSSSGISAVLSGQAGISDNGATYGSAAVAVPQQVLRYNSYNTSNRTLTLRGLTPGVAYSLKFFGSRANTGNKTVVAIGSSRDTINTDNNVSDIASFSNIIPDATGRIVVDLWRIGTYNYLAGFTISQGSTSNPNQPPVVNAGADGSVQLPVSTFNLSGTASDPDGTIVSSSWTKVSGPAALITSSSSLITAVTGLVQGTYVFRLTATDNDGSSSSDDVTITVGSAPANQLPVADAGPDKSITLPVNSVTLAGSGSDGDGTISSYSWTKISGPSGGTIANTTLANTNINSLQQGSYVYRLTVTDNSGAQDSDDVTVTVNPATSAPSGRMINVNVFNGSTAYSNSAWNNWLPGNNTTSGTFKYSDQSQSTVTASISGQAGVADNGSTYASSATVIPKEVLRFNSYNTSNRTLTLKGLNPGGKYTIRVYGSRANTGNKTVVQSGNNRDTISTDNNTSDFAELNGLSASSSGQLVLDVYRIGTYNYIAGFTIIEEDESRNTMTTQASPLVTEPGDPQIAYLYKIETYPNPVSTILNVKLELPSNSVGGTLELIGPSGSRVLQQKVPAGAGYNQQINVASLPSGMYTLTYTSGKHKVSSQVIKQ